MLDDLYRLVLHDILQKTAISWWSAEGQQDSLSQPLSVRPQISAEDPSS